MKWLRFALLGVSAVAVALFDISIAPFLPFPWNAMSPALAIGVLLVSIGNGRHAVFFMAVAGLVLDVFLGEKSLFAVGRLPAVILTARALADSVLTNRSVYAASALVVVARCLDMLWLFAGSGILTLLFHRTPQFMSVRAVAFTFAWDIAFIVLLFVGIVSFTRKFSMTPAVPRKFRSPYG